MKQKGVVLAAVIAIVVAALAGSVWLYARMLGDDDRPPIIVRGGSIYFDGGIEGASPQCCNNWKKDLIGKQWKPKPDDKTGVRAFAVTVTGVRACSITALEAQEVLIDYKSASETRTFRVYIKAKIFLFFPGKHEPKIDSPVELKNEILSSDDPPKKPGRLEYAPAGWISRLQVGAKECPFTDADKASLVITIQPKREQR